MKNQGLTVDFHNIKTGQASVRGTDDALVEAQNYIEFLEGKEDRLTKLENILNQIEDDGEAGSKEFLDRFKELKNA